METITGEKAVLWGGSIIGFGKYHYKYDSGHEGNAPLAAFSPRKESISIYLCCQYDSKESLLKQLGKYKIGKACLYIKNYLM